MQRAVMVDEPTGRWQVASSCDPAAPFCEQSQALGFHDLPAVYGRGAAMVDVDNDGWEDIWQSHTQGWGFGEDRDSELWRNNGDGTFSPMELGIPSTHTYDNWSGAWGDLDNDGDQDVLLVNGGYDGPGKLRLYRNDLDTTGAFTAVTVAAGIRTDMKAWWGASFADYDRDGWLDIVATARSMYQVAPCCTGSISAFEDPTGTLVVYRNMGNGTFEDMSSTINGPQMWFDLKNPVWWDYNNDGWPDLWISNMGTWASRFFDTDSPPPINDMAVLLRNDQGLGFTDVSDLIFSDEEYRSSVFASALWDFNQDGRDDLYIGRGQYQDYIAMSRPGGIDLVGASYGLDMVSGFSAKENTMGLALGDVTGDGLPEIFVGTGWPDYEADTIIYRHLGVGVGVERMTIDFEGWYPGFHHGITTGDIDHDGDVDVFWNMGGFGPYDIGRGQTIDPGVNNQQYPMMFLNHAGSEHRTAAIRLEGTVSNRDAIGARIEVVNQGGQSRHYSVRSMGGFQSRNSFWNTVSLGVANRAMVYVDWPSGTRTANMVSRNQRVRLIEPQ